MLPDFTVGVRFRASNWNARVSVARSYLPLWPASWLLTVDESHSSKSSEVTNVWQVYHQALDIVPVGLDDRVSVSLDSSDVSSTWFVWTAAVDICSARDLWCCQRPSSFSSGPLAGLWTAHLGCRLDRRPRAVPNDPQQMLTCCLFFEDDSLSGFHQFRVKLKYPH